MGSSERCLAEIEWLWPRTQIVRYVAEDHEEELVMRLDEFLAGLKPELNDGFDVLEGIYRCVIKNEEKAETGYVTGTFKNGDPYARFQMTIDIVDVLSGNGNPGRRFWIRYQEDEDGLKKLVNDLFTAGLLEKVDKSSVESLKATIPTLAGQTLYYRAWAWTPEKDRQGNLIPENQREARQQGSVKSEKALKKVLAKVQESPF